MRQIIRNSDQTLADVAAQHLGDVELLFDLALENDVSITNDVKVNLQSTIEVADKKIVEVMNKPENIPASNIEGEWPEGIGYWRVGIDFVVS